MVKVNLVFRKRHANVFSIEYLFNNLFEEFRRKDTNHCFEKVELPEMSEGLFKRIVNTFYLLKYRGEIIHVTGDVHYVVLGGIFSKRILTIHDLSFLNRGSGIARAILKLFWVTLPVKFAHKVTVVSKATRQALLREVNVEEDKVVVVYDFIDPIFSAPVPDHLFNKDRPRLLQIGTAFNKNLDRLIPALKGIRCTLVIVGRLDHRIIKLLEENGIRYDNKYKLSQQELCQEYQNADILVYPSTVEGFGMPILEAQASGLPVLTSNCSSMPEIAGGAAILVDPHDTNSIRQGVLELINDDGLRTDLIKKGYANVARFSKEKVAESYLAVYSTVI